MEAGMRCFMSTVRRGALGVLLAGCGGTVAAGAPPDAGAPEAGGLVDSSTDGSSGPLDSGADGASPDAAAPVEAGVVDAPAEAGPACGAGDVFFLSFASYPKLAAVGGSALVQAPGYSDPVCQEDAIIVLQPVAGQFLAFSGSSTDVCCNILYVPPDLESACHHATYDLNGQCISGSLPPLTPLVVCSNSAGVGVTL
jgi:hypothetical protein